MLRRRDILEGGIDNVATAVHGRVTMTAVKTEPGRNQLSWERSSVKDVFVPGVLRSSTLGPYDSLRLFSRFSFTPSCHAMQRQSVHS